MSLFGSLMGDFEDDPYYGSHMQSMQRMNNMINSMFADPFGMMGGTMMHAQNPQNQMIPMGGMQMMPFGFPPMPSIGSMFANMNNMTNNPNCHSFTSSSIMTMTSGPDGRPQVYQESMSSRSVPGGVRETKKTVSDSRSGTRKLAIGHHIGERAHIIEREQNVHNGDQEERQEFINLEEEEADQFNHEWQTRTRRPMGAIGGPSYGSHDLHRGHQDDRPLALPSTVPSSSQEFRNHSRPISKPRRAIRPAHTSKTNSKASTSRPAETSTSASSPSSATSAAQATSSPRTSSPPPTAAASESAEKTSPVAGRKREHSPEPEIVCTKRISGSPSVAQRTD